MKITSNNYPLISVLMPVYNAEKYVGVAIESILNQTYRDYEFIIINDGSTDRSADVIRSYSDPRIISIENEINLGIAVSLNHGLSLAQGDYIARMDGDDISLPQRFEKQVEYLNHHDNIGVVGSAVGIIDHLGRRSRISMFPQEDSLIRWTMCFTNPMAHGSMMMRREIVMNAGGYPATPAEDYNLWEHLSCSSAFSNLPDVLLYLRRHEENLVSLSRNRAAILRDSALISQRRITKTLGEEVPLSLVEKLWGVPFEESEEALQIAELINRLVSVSTAEARLPKREKQNISNDAARRLLKIQARPNIASHHRWQIFQMALRLDSFVLFRVPLRRISRAIRSLSFSAS